MIQEHPSLINFNQLADQLNANRRILRRILEEQPHIQAYKVNGYSILVNKDQIPAIQRELIALTSDRR